MKPYEALAQEIDDLKPNTAFRITPSAQRMIQAALRMVGNVEIVMAALGANGSICARDDRVQRVMDSLYEIDRM